MLQDSKRVDMDVSVAMGCLEMLVLRMHPLTLSLEYIKAKSESSGKGM